ncbi:hypothetical protein LEN26_014607 [Aphanomyces euteiches]|nr:hypothetical protein LEN26_014607 [Aphanomyces euteiches]
MRLALALSVAFVVLADAAKGRDFQTDLDTIHSGQLYTPPEARQSPPRSPRSPPSQSGPTLTRTGRTTIQRVAPKNKSTGARLRGAVSKGLSKVGRCIGAVYLDLGHMPEERGAEFPLPRMSLDKKSKKMPNTRWSIE